MSTGKNGKQFPLKGNGASQVSDTERQCSTTGLLSRAASPPPLLSHWGLCSCFAHGTSLALDLCPQALSTPYFRGSHHTDLQQRTRLSVLHWTCSPCGAEGGAQHLTQASQVPHFQATPQPATGHVEQETVLIFRSWMEEQET